MKKKVFSFFKKVIINYGEMAMLQYCQSKETIPIHKS